MNDAGDEGHQRRPVPRAGASELLAFHAVIIKLDDALDAFDEEDRCEIESHVKRLLSCVKQLAPELFGGMADVDPMRMLPASELGAKLGVGDGMVRLREQRGELFSVLPVGRQRGKRYPAFQAWPGIFGEPLRQVLALSVGCSDQDRSDFFARRHPDVHGLTPVEVLLGNTLEERVISLTAQLLLQAPANDRLDSVITAVSKLRPSTGVRRQDCL